MKKKKMNLKRHEMSDDIILYDTKEAAKVEINIPTFELVPADWPGLYNRLPEFDFNDTNERPNELASTLVETCKKHNGLGLSANQCGIPKRVFVMGTDDEYVAFFNPKVIKSEGESHLEEGCLSWPLLNLRITRPKKIWVEYQDFTGAKKEAIFDGISARCFLHELDHMNGIMYTSRVKPLALQFGLKKLEKIRRKYFNPKMMKKMTNGNQKAHT
jgi:peptide deformylase